MPNKLTVPHLVDTTMFYASEGGGVRTYLAAKAKWLKHNPGLRHTIVAPSIRPSEVDPDVTLAPVAGIPIPGNWHYQMARSVASVAETICELRPNLIEAGDPYQFAWAALRAGRKANVPVVAYYHSDLPTLVQRRYGTVAAAVARRYVSRLYPQFDLVMAPSIVMAQGLRALGIERVVHQPLGVDTELFSPTRKTGRLRRQLGLPESTRLLVFAGRFTREKGLPLLLETVERLGDPYHLLLIGGSLPVAPERCTCLPFQRDGKRLAALLAECDVLVHAGDQETFGLVVLEAMACGLPVAGIAAGGVAELVDDSTGGLAPPRSSRLLAEVIDGLYRRDLVQLGRNAREKALSHYGWQQAIARLANRYESLLTSPRTAGIESDLSYAVE